MLCHQVGQTCPQPTDPNDRMNRKRKQEARRYMVLMDVWIGG